MSRILFFELLLPGVERGRTYPAFARGRLLRRLGSLRWKEEVLLACSSPVVCGDIAGTLTTREDFTFDTPANSSGRSVSNLSAAKSL